MVKDNIACPMPILDEKVMRYIGKRTQYQLENMTNAKYGEVYYCTDSETFYLSIGGNEWLTWGSGSSPTSTITIYTGALDSVPESTECLNNLTSAGYTAAQLTTGIGPFTVVANSQHVTFAYKPAECTLTSITQGGIESITGFSQVTIGEYKFFYTPESVYDPTGETQYKLVFGV